MLPAWRNICSTIPQRWVFAIMGFFGIINIYTMRICLSLAIVEMVVPTESVSNGTSDDTCSSFESVTDTSSSAGTYEWSEYTQGIILSSFFWGYSITHLPGGIVAEKFGGKYTLGLGILLSAILTLLTPTIVEHFESTGLIVLRFVLGLAEGTAFPAITVLIAKWAPPQERSVIGTSVISGAQLGTVIGTSLSGVLIHNFSIGWPIVFYVFGVCGMIWFALWTLLCYDAPERHPFISAKEKKYLHDSMNDHTHDKPLPIPWRHLLCSVPMWALAIGSIGHDWGFYTMVTDLPKYMSSVLKFSIQANGLLTSVPYLCLWVSSIAWSWLADWMISRKKLSRTNIRKLFGLIAAIGPAVFIVAASYAGCDRVIVVVLFTIGMATMGPYISGLKVNSVDVSPNFSGTLMAITNGLGCIAGILAPYAVGVLTPNQTLWEWRLVFWITFATLVGSGLVFAIWADGEVQYWNDPGFREQLGKNIEDRSKRTRKTDDQESLPK